ncbi:siderophore-interacting protein [Lysobacter antibioticus]|uniref:siderophore-interacting protein n=1 Tax=Lysobacter antibioticus TaxID=84531 RepID=UPI000347BD2C|nr:siderophore-interacting protein [Lysobacter antibioticus]
MSAPSRPRLLRVARIVQRSPQMRRITLSGADLAGFPGGCEGAHIKLLFPAVAGEAPALPGMGERGPVWPADAPRPHVRTYTVARHDPQACELDVDIVLHGDDGPASRWAATARPGDPLGLAGPGGPPLFQPQAERFVLIGDPSSYALLCAVIAQLPAQARVDALLEVPDAGEILDLPSHPRLHARWFSRDGAPAAPSRRLLDALRAMPWPTGQRLSVTLAGETAQVVAIRDFLAREREVPRSMMYAVPYWKETWDEDRYHEERHRIMDAFEEAAA